MEMENANLSPKNAKPMIMSMEPALPAKILKFMCCSQTEDVPKLWVDFLRNRLATMDFILKEIPALKSMSYVISTTKITENA